MPLEITTADLGIPKKATVHADAGKVLEITISRDIRRVEFEFREAGGGATSGAWARSGTEGDPQVADAFPVASGQPVDLLLSGRARRPSAHKLYVSAGAPAAVVHIAAFEE